MNKTINKMFELAKENIYTYNPYSTTDFTRNGQNKTFSSRFQYDYDKASEAAKREREIRVNAYNEMHSTNKYEISKFVDENSYNLDLETFIGNHGDHALYACELLDNPTYSEYKDVGDDCSSFTMSVMYYATKGAMDEYEALNIYDLGGGALANAKDKDSYYKALKEIGFEKIPVKNGTFDELQSGDILVASNHYEFYYVDENGKRTSFGWGSVKDKFPNNTCSIKQSPGHVYFEDEWSSVKYKYIYRLTKEAIYER